MEHQVFKYKSLPSTNLEAEALLQSGEIEGPFFIVADYQENGKGRGGNSWKSEANLNLLFSWIVFPAFLSVSRQFQLSKAISLAICDYLDNFLDEVSIKWPNDIFFRNSKIGGILIENSIIGDSLKHSIVGVGLNINQQSFPEFPYTATSVKSETGKDVAIESAREDIFDFLADKYKQLQIDDSGKIDDAYLSRLFKRDELADFADQHGEFQGIIRGVSEHGELLVQTECGIRNFGFHEIKMLHTNR